MIIHGTRHAGQTSPAEERDLANPSAAVRARAVAHFCACVDLAAELGASGVGIGPQAGGRVRPIEGFQWSGRRARVTARAETQRR